MFARQLDNDDRVRVSLQLIVRVISMVSEKVCRTLHVPINCWCVFNGTYHR